MQYIFGQINDVDILKTVGEHHTDLTGRQTIRREYPDRVIEDVFTVVDHYASKQGADGMCYDWYHLADHYRDTDRFMPQKPAIDETVTGIEDAMIENDIAVNDRLTDIEDAILELDEAISGGNE